MYRAATIFGSLLIGAVVFLAMFPSAKLGMNIDTTGWSDLFAVMARFLPYALVILFILWLLSKARGSGSGQ